MIASTRPSLSTETTSAGVEIVTLDGEFDLSHTPQIGYRMTDIFGECDRDVVIDLRGVCFLDSKMVRTLVHAFKQADARGCRLVLVRPNPMVWRVFEVGGLSEMFPSFDHLRERTTVEHLLRDHSEGPQTSREQHYAEWAEFIEGIGPEGVPARSAEYAAADAHHHFHVWELDTFLALLAAIDLNCELLHAQLSQKEFAVILRKR